MAAAFAPRPQDDSAVAVAVVESNLLGQTEFLRALRGIPGVRLVAVVERPLQLPEPPVDIPGLLFLDMAFAGASGRRIREFSAVGWSVYGLSPGGLDSEADVRASGVIAVLRTPVGREELARCISEVRAAMVRDVSVTPRQDRRSVGPSDLPSGRGRSNGHPSRSDKSLWN